MEIWRDWQNCHRSEPHESLSVDQATGGHATKWLLELAWCFSGGSNNFLDALWAEIVRPLVHAHRGGLPTSQLKAVLWSSSWQSHPRPGLIMDFGLPPQNNKKSVSSWHVLERYRKENASHTVLTTFRSEEGGGSVNFTPWRSQNWPGAALVAKCSATPASVAATPPCSATPFQPQISVRHLPGMGGGRCDT